MTMELMLLKRIDSYVSDTYGFELWGRRIAGKTISSPCGPALLWKKVFAAAEKESFLRYARFCIMEKSAL